ncbi:hypothetical protein [Spartinivicinus poritis]|uniref:Uncharacterized protein n=1 Tax=Spartinivicinus poritis TaxID=2994640 RepID=A0ABT5UFD2_9GAMM|nr:hypothetical protein [Spartinivicinus sp. A2-2]MDE1465017.1 hypothetical protein [Spartinivicinus sp. A2-2]
MSDFPIYSREGYVGWIRLRNERRYPIYDKSLYLIGMVLDEKYFYQGKTRGSIGGTKANPAHIGYVTPEKNTGLLVFRDCCGWAVGYCEGVKDIGGIEPNLIKDKPTNPISMDGLANHFSPSRLTEPAKVVSTGIWSHVSWAKVMTGKYKCKDKIKHQNCRELYNNGEGYYGRY